MGVHVLGIGSNKAGECCSDISLKTSLEEQQRIMQKEGCLKEPRWLSRLCLGREVKIQLLD